MAETVVMEVMVEIPFMGKVAREEMGVIATLAKVEMEVTEEIVSMVKAEMVGMEVMDLKAEAREDKVVKDLWEKEKMGKMVKKNKGSQIKNKFISKIVFLLAFSPSICISACEKTACDSGKLPAYTQNRAKDGAHGASAQGSQNGQNGQDGQKGSIGLSGGHGGNGGDSESGKGGDGGQGGDAD